MIKKKFYLLKTGKLLRLNTSNKKFVSHIRKTSSVAETPVGNLNQSQDKSLDLHFIPKQISEVGPNGLTARQTVALQK
jgi:hypothetical protein